jgi:quercetin dioxygenase-like cupin family protein
MKKYVFLSGKIFLAYLVIAIIFNMANRKKNYPSVKGKTYVNKITGETFVFRQVTSGDTGNTVFDFILAPKGFVGTEHIHLEQDETFKVVSGNLNMIVNRKKFVLHPGEEYCVKKGSAHRVWNDENDTCHSIVSYSPGNNSEFFLVTLTGLANAGKTNKDGQPSFMQMMLLVNQYQVYIPGPPVFLQKALSFLLSPISALMGNKSYYDEYT